MNTDLPTDGAAVEALIEAAVVGHPDMSALLDLLNEHFDAAWLAAGNELPE